MLAFQDCRFDASSSCLHRCIFASLHPFSFFMLAFQDVTFVSWSKTGDYLALGTGKGTMCIYHRRTNEKVSWPILSYPAIYHI